MKLEKPRIERGFTLVEILIVIAIISVISVVVVVMINPAEQFKTTRDSQRIADLSLIDLTLTELTTVLRRYDLGSSNTVYVSLSDTSPTCENLLGDLPSLPDGWSYGCVTAENLRKIDGTGWIPVDFTRIPGISAFSVLPIDPKNEAEGGLYYTYVSGSWEITAMLESKKYLEESASKNGSGFFSFQVGNNIDATPSVMWSRIPQGNSCLEISQKWNNTTDSFYLIKPGNLSSFEVFCDMTNDSGGWTLVNDDLVDSINIQNSLVETDYDKNGGVIITSTATETGCGGPTSGTTIKIINDMPWTNIRHIGEFYSRSSCWSINGIEHYGGQSGHGNLITYNPSIDTMRNCYLTCEQPQFSNFTQRCDNDDGNFFRFNDSSWKRFETILRRDDVGKVSGIAVGVSCNQLTTKWRSSKIYVR